MNGTGMDRQWSFQLLGSRWEMTTSMKLWKFYGFECSISIFPRIKLQGFCEITQKITDFAWRVLPSISPHFNGELFHSPAFSEVGAPWRAAAAGGWPRVLPNAQRLVIAVAADAVGDAAVRHVRAEEATRGAKGGRGGRGELTAGVGWILKPWFGGVEVGGGSMVDISAKIYGLSML